MMMMTIRIPILLVLLSTAKTVLFPSEPLPMPCHAICLPCFAYTQMGQWRWMARTVTAVHAATDELATTGEPSERQSQHIKQRNACTLQQPPHTPSGCLRWVAHFTWV